MVVSTSKDELERCLAKHGQAHLLRFWDELNGSERAALSAQLRALDWERLGGWIQNALADVGETQLPADLEPAPYYPLAPRDAREEQLYADARKRGEELLRAGRAAGLTVAGGQGTRLGYDAPKGTIPISPVRGKSLFQLFAEGIARAQEKYNARLPWYIMTSPLNDAATRAFLADHAHFGLNPDDVTCFVQGTLPAFDLDGRLLLSGRGCIAVAPNGHGGSLLALRESGALADMAARGIDVISYWQVDNPLVNMFDPLFLGLHDLLGSDMSSRAVVKTGPLEKLGAFCLVDGQLTVIEYSDMPENSARELDERGALRFRAGSPAIHVLSTQFAARLTADGCGLPLHTAHKKVPCVDERGQGAEADAPNAVKLEMFVFDALPLADRPLILEMERAEQFGPVKNRTGVDSLASCQRLLVERSAKWLEAAAVPVPRTADGAPACLIELSPRRYLDKDDVIQSGTVFEMPPAGEEGYYE